MHCKQINLKYFEMLGVNFECLHNKLLVIWYRTSGTVWMPLEDDCEYQTDKLGGWMKILSSRQSLLWTEHYCIFRGFISSATMIFSLFISCDFRFLYNNHIRIENDLLLSMSVEGSMQLYTFCTKLFFYKM